MDFVFVVPVHLPNRDTGLAAVRRSSLQCSLLTDCRSSPPPPPPPPLRIHPPIPPFLASHSRPHSHFPPSIHTRLLSSPPSPARRNFSRCSGIARLSFSLSLPQRSTLSADLQQPSIHPSPARNNLAIWNPALALDQIITNSSCLFPQQAAASRLSDFSHHWSCTQSPTPRSRNAALPTRRSLREGTARLLVKH